MWLFTKRGFYSIVEDKIQKGNWQVRARVKGDLENLLKLSNVDTKIITTKKADYLYRIVLNAEQLFHCMLILTRDIDYSNFKNSVKEQPDQKEKCSILSNIWYDMYELQESKIVRNPKAKLKKVRTKYGKTVYTSL